MTTPVNPVTGGGVAPGRPSRGSYRSAALPRAARRLAGTRRAAHDPDHTLRQLTMPVLAVLGGQDAMPDSYGLTF